MQRTLTSPGSARGRTKITLLVAVAVAAAAVGLSSWYYLFRVVEQPYFENDDDSFNYGSIGNAQTDGVPYWIWRVLPTMFPEYLPGPGGYSAVGLVWEPGKELPVGLSKKTVGVPRVAINCGFCHQSTYRLAPNELPTFVPGGTGNRLEPLAYIRFLSAAGKDQRFNPDAVMAEIQAIYEMPFVERLFYRYAFIPATKKALIRQGQAYEWTYTRPDWGKGRIAPFNPVKFGILGMALDGTVDNADMMPLWNLADKTGIAPNGEVKAVHWDGLVTSLRESLLAGVIGDGMTYKTFAATDPQLRRIEKWIAERPYPKSPFSTTREPSDPFYVAPAQVAAGEALHRTHCGECHTRDGARFRTVIPVREVETDHHRAEMWNAEAMRRYTDYQEEYDWGFEDFQNVEGYVAVDMDGLWLRAPYLHNGSVPTLRAMLQPPDQRPKVFYRGYDVIDTENGGYVAQGEEARRVGFRYDTGEWGNANKGHAYGTDLEPREKEALLAYLKTL